MIKLNFVRLYLPDFLMERRIENVQSLANYTNSLVSAVGACLSSSEHLGAKGLFIAVGVKPGRKSKIWCEPVERNIRSESLTKLESELNWIWPVAVQEGPIALALNLDLASGGPAKFPEMPKAWLEAVGGSSGRALMIPDGLFQVIWPE